LANVVRHPEGKDALMLELIPSCFVNLGLPPTLESCSRDVYPKEFTLSFSHVLKILQGMADAAQHMHERGIMHGDFYAHNIMIDTEGNSILGDFGGASYFEPSEIEVRNGLERLEVRAFGCLIEELIVVSKNDHHENKQKLISLKEACMQKETSKRPLFSEIHKYLS